MDFESLKADSVKTEDPNGKDRLLELIELHQKAKREFEEAELKLVSAKDFLRKIEEVAIPEYFDEIGAGEGSKLAIENFTVSVKTDIKAHIKKERFEEAIDWLKETGNEGVIKPQINMLFEKGQLDWANEVLQEIMEIGCGVDFALDFSVHPMTLKSLVKERLKKNASVPMDLFGVFEIKKAVIKQSQSVKR